MTAQNQTAPQIAESLSSIAYAAALAAYALDAARRTHDNWNEFCHQIDATPEQWQKLESLWRAVVTAQRAETNARMALAARKPQTH